MATEGGYEYPLKGYGYTMADGDEKRGLTSPAEYNHGPHPLIEQASIVGTQVRMVIFILCACAAALGQHFFYAYINGRSADGGLFPKFQKFADVNDQSFVNFFGNQIARIAVVCLSAAVAIAYAQVFWWRLKTRRMTIERIDGLQDFSEAPWNPLTWPSAYSLRLVGVVALCHALMDQVSNLTPGAMTIATAPYDTTCRVPNVDLRGADLTGDELYNGTTYHYVNVNGRATSYVSRVLVAGTTLPPPSPCGTCNYNLTFVAPAVKCVNITQELLPVIDYHLPWDSDVITVWNGMYYLDLTGNVIMSRNLAGTSSKSDDLFPVQQQPVVALNCTGWNATYHVAVTQSSNTTVIPTKIELGEQLTYDKLGSAPDPFAHQLLALWDAFSYSLNSTVEYWPSYNDFDDASSLVAWSPIGGGSYTGIAWQWLGNLEEVIPEMMQNVSLSLLSGQLSDAYNSTLTDTTVPCQKIGVVFFYSPLRLAITYFVALTVAAICIAYGFIAIGYNRRGETLGFSRILAAYPAHPSASEQLDLKTLVKAQQDGRLTSRATTLSRDLTS